MTTLKAGPELDRMIAEKIFNAPMPPPSEARAIHITGIWSWNGGKWNTLRFSTDIAEAWKVVEKIQATLNPIEIAVVFDDEGWATLITMGDGAPIEAGADTAPLGICLASLRAVGGAE